MWMFAIQIAIWSAAFVGIAAIAAFGQSSPVLTGTAAYGDWRSDAPGVRRKIAPTDDLERSGELARLVEKASSEAVDKPDQEEPDETPGVT